ncbi:DUF3995 domain-containing protein [Georgenia satyanarayanai]|uniref:DUF3995 domain-containing protein n=1 Tax=Georgenia satyanarayanai TaxID=860221 RepID=UPI000DA25C61|nr:DUF3995 domain-containing protein [Georgenia satyanarayanai]
MTVPPASGRAARSWLWVACVAGLVHAGFSASWAVGGEWLLDTVGQWAVELRRSSPVVAAWGLAGIALVKSLAALVPVVVDRGRLPGRRLWRGLSWAGGAALLVYGGVNVVVSNAVLATRDPATYDRAAMVGHAWLWDPLFALWGGALLAHLWLSRPGRAVGQRRRAATSGMAAQ